MSTLFRTTIIGSSKNTGKTESVKALGVQLGRFVLVFCCDETFDFQAMGRIFVGLCQVGAWGCFDEFNRLEERILSAVSQQVQAIQQGLASLVKSPNTEIELVGKRLKINKNIGGCRPFHRSIDHLSINYLTSIRHLHYNQSELRWSFAVAPQSHQVIQTVSYNYSQESAGSILTCLRMAMTRPDRELIAQVMLFSQGFRTAESLASKIVPFFNLCDEQLSPQPHYDFGLRALKAVLASAGILKRERLQNSRLESETENDVAGLSDNISEQIILIQSVTETIVPKLVADDVPLLTRYSDSKTLPLTTNSHFHFQPPRRCFPWRGLLPGGSGQTTGTNYQSLCRKATCRWRPLDCQNPSTLPDPKDSTWFDDGRTLWNWKN